MAARAAREPGSGAPAAAAAAVLTARAAKMRTFEG